MVLLLFHFYPRRSHQVYIVNSEIILSELCKKVAIKIHELTFRFITTIKGNLNGQHMVILEMH